MRKALSPRELGFTKRDHQRLAKALREESDVRTFRRVQAVFMVAEEYDLATTAHLTGFSQRSVYRFVSRALVAGGSCCESNSPESPPTMELKMLREESSE